MPQRRGHGGRPKLREADPGEKITISVRITPEMKQRLEEAAKESGRSQSQEAEFRLERSFDRSNLLGQVIELVYGKQTAGLLMVLGAAMAHAVEKAGGDPKREDWALDAKSYLAAKYAARVLLELWTPKLLGAADRSSTAVGRAAMEDGFAAVVAFVGSWLDGAMKSHRRSAIAEVMIEFLGPIASGMIEELPNQEKAHKAMRSAWEGAEVKEGKGDRTQKKGVRA